MAAQQGQQLAQRGGQPPAAAGAHIFQRDLIFVLDALQGQQLLVQPHTLGAAGLQYLGCFLRGGGVFQLQVVQRPQQRFAGLLVQKTSQRVVVIVHRKLHAGTKAGGAVQCKVRVYI